MCKELIDFILCGIKKLPTCPTEILQRSETWCYEVRGPQYHWVTDLYERINLPILPAIVKALSEAVKLRAAELQKQKSNHSKALRVRMKVAITLVHFE